MADMVFTNKNNISPFLAVWLAMNEYRQETRPNVISATTLIRPLRQVVLARKYKDLSKQADIADLVNSRMGTALHDSIEKTWSQEPAILKNLLGQFGIPAAMLDKIKIQEPIENIKEDDIPIWVEQRHEKEVTAKSGNKYIISGQFDAVVSWRVFDNKSTSVWTHIYGSNDKKYAEQGSIYRWLVPHMIKDDLMQIEHIFTDWSGVKAMQDKQYPQSRILSKTLPLLSYVDTEKMIQDKIDKIDYYLEQVDSALPLCTDEELWREKDIYKYYKDPSKTSRSTANFGTEAEANFRLSADGNSGIVIKHPGGVKACKYCSVQNVCEQYKQLKLTNQIKD